MSSSRLFWKLMLVCAGLNIAAATFVGVVITRWQAEQIHRDVETRLRDAALLVRSDLADEMVAGPSDELQRRIAQWGRETGLRFALLAMGGAGLADSAKAKLAEAVSTENHRDRPEIVMARSRGEGSASRTSVTFGAPYRYFAERIDKDGNPVGIVRAGMPEANMQAE